MSRRKPADTKDSPPTELVVDRPDAEAKIVDRIALGRELVERPIKSWDDLEGAQKEYRKWSDYNRELLRRLFSDGAIAEEYSGNGSGMIAIGGPPSLHEDTKEFRDDVNTKLSRLDSIRDRLELMERVGPAAAPAGRQRDHAAPSTSKVFLVHGHDEAVRESTARFLQRLGLEPIILHEQQSAGRTIIEKLETHSDVEYAIVLLTPDDVGAMASGKQDMVPRARQNVILELGFFLGKLGRSHVCALHKGDVELPSDFIGVVYVPYDAGGGWQLALARELKGAGFGIDLNDVL